MANPHKGEIEFEADGKTYTLRYSIDAICALEEKAGKGFLSIAGELSDPFRTSVRMLRMAVWAGLQEHHPELSLKDAGELIIAAGGASAVLEHYSKAIALAFPEVESEPSSPPPTPGRARKATSTGSVISNGGSN